MCHKRFVCGKNVTDAMFLLCVEKQEGRTDHDILTRILNIVFFWTPKSNLDNVIIQES